MSIDQEHLEMLERSLDELLFSGLYLESEVAEDISRIESDIVDLKHRISNQ